MNYKIYHIYMKLSTEPSLIQARFREFRKKVVHCLLILQKVDHETKKSAVSHICPTKPITVLKR